MIGYIWIQIIQFIDLFRIVRNPFTPQTKRLATYYILILGSVALTFVALFIDMSSIPILDDMTHFTISLVRLMPVPVEAIILASIVCVLKRQGTNRKQRMAILVNLCLLLLIQIAILTVRLLPLYRRNIFYLNDRDFIVRKAITPEERRQIVRTERICGIIMCLETIVRMLEPKINL